MKVLVIEDDANVVDAVELCLQIRWPEVSVSSAATGNRGLDILKSESFDIVILDLNLPDIDGLEALKRIRLFSKVPIIILTVRGDEDNQARGLEMGADDYIVKPFRPRDFIARVNTVVRRAGFNEVTMEDHPLITKGVLALNLAANEVKLGEEIVKLTPNESKVLYVLMKNAEHTLSNGNIIQEVWGRDYAATDIVRTYIRRLRDKLKDKPPQIILNQRGGGYRFVSPT